MLTSKICAVLGAGAALSIAAGSLAVAQLKAPEAGTVYSAHSASVGGCPDMVWHVEVGSHSTLTGTVAYDGLRKVWRLSGAFQPDGKFHLNGTEMGGDHRKGVVDGRLNPDGSLIMTLHSTAGSTPCDNKTISLPWFRGGNDPYPNVPSL